MAEKSKNLKFLKKIMLVTGRLAAPSLQQIVNKINSQNKESNNIEVSLCELPISVAALMTFPWALSHIKEKIKKNAADEIIMPGRVQGDIKIIEDALPVPVRRGPEELWEIPDFLNISDILAEQDYLPPAFRPKIIAEIVDAWRMTTDEVLQKAEKFRQDGADYIDLGSSPSGGIPDIEGKIGALKERGFLVSVDTFDKDTIIKACKCGADMILSVNASNLDIAHEINCPVVVIPDCENSDEKDYISSLNKNMAAVNAKSAQAIADPILAPPMMGMTASLCRYSEYRAQNPDVPMLIGAGNVSELLEADSTGVNALLAAFIFELRIDYVLTTEVAPWTKGTIKELSSAFDMMWMAAAHKTLPKNLAKIMKISKKAKDLCCLKGHNNNYYSRYELKKMQEAVTDANWRIFKLQDENKICAFNADKFLYSADADEIFSNMEIKNPSEAFYIGKELQKAKIALFLGKDFVQDEKIKWGALS